MTDPWKVLGLEPTDDARVIKKAYARLLRQHRPDDDPGGFQRVNDAYQSALSLAQRAAADGADAVDIDPATAPPIAPEDASRGGSRQALDPDRARAQAMASELFAVLHGHGEAAAMARFDAMTAQANEGSLDLSGELEALLLDTLARVEPRPLFFRHVVEHYGWARSIPLGRGQSVALESLLSRLRRHEATLIEDFDRDSPLVQRYAQMGTEDLVSLYLRGELTDAACAIAEAEFHSRGVDRQRLARVRAAGLSGMSAAELLTFAATADLNHVTREAVDAELAARGIDQSQIRDLSLQLVPGTPWWRRLSYVLLAMLLIKPGAMAVAWLMQALIWTSPADRWCQDRGYRRADHEYSVVLTTAAATARCKNRW